MRSTYAIPVAILAGSALVAIAVFAGLRAPGGAATAPAPPTLASVATRPLAPSSDPGARTPPAPGSPSMLVPPSPGAAAGPARDAARAELEKVRARYVTQCWAPSVAKSTEPKSAEYSFQIAFDAEGHERARGISETNPTPARADVAACLRSFGAAISVPPPGRPVTVTVALSLP